MNVHPYTTDHLTKSPSPSNDAPEYVENLINDPYEVVALAEDARNKALENKEHLKTNRPIMYWVTRCIILVLVATSITLLIVFREPIIKAASAFCTWVGEHPFAGCLAIATIYAALIVLFIPALLLTTTSGWAF